MKQNRLTVHTTSIFERWVADYEFVGKNPQGPVVNLLTVLSSLHHLWWQIVQRPTQCHPSVSRCMYTPSKITNLQLTIDSQEQVFWLDIPVNDVFRV